MHNLGTYTTKEIIFSFYFSAWGLSCYADKTNLEIKEDCGMHTGCIKKYYPKCKYP